MIIYAKDDVVSLSGSLTRNHWLTIKAAANLLLRENPTGIIIDCSGLTTATGEGTRTLLHALRYIRQAEARMLVCNVPEDLLVQVRKIPGLRSGLPVAKSVEEARASLRATTAHTIEDRHAVLVPLLDGMDVPNVVGIASGFARQARVPVTLFCCLEVPRSYPLGASLPVLEAQAHAMMRQAEREAAHLRQPYTTHIARDRDLSEGLLAGILEHESSLAVIGVTKEMLESTRVVRLLDALVRRAPCPVLIARNPLGTAAGGDKCYRRIPLINRRTADRPPSHMSLRFARWWARRGCSPEVAGYEKNSCKENILFVPTGDGDRQGALRFACRYARMHRVRLTVVKIVEIPMVMPVDAPDAPGLAEANAVMDSVERIAKQEKIPVKTEVIASRNTATALLEMARSRGYDLLILEAGEVRSSLGTLETENTVRYLLQRAPVPVWLVRMTETQEEIL